MKHTTSVTARVASRAAALCAAALLVSSCSASFGESGTVTVTEYVSAEDSATSGASAETTPALNDDNTGGSDSAAAESATQSSGAGTDSGAGADAFHFDSGTLEIGPFDPDEVYPNVFDPCKEISDEEFAERGFKTDGLTGSRGGGVLLGCSLVPMEGYHQVSVDLSGNLITTAELKARSANFLPIDSSRLPGLFEYQITGEDPSICRLTVETVRGQVQISVNAFNTGLDHSELCAGGQWLLESFTY